jgi:hypothetical protein
MGFLSDIFFGNAITNLTNVFEEIEATRSTRFIGAGGGFDSLPIYKQATYSKKIPKWLSTLEKRPRHEVTLNLVKNITISVKSGRAQRSKAQEKLLDWLVEKGVALDADSFFASYGAPKTTTPNKSEKPSIEFQFTASMPDTSKLEPIEKISLTYYTIVFYKSPPTFIESHVENKTSLIKYFYAAYIIDATNNKIERIFTSETGLAGDCHFCSFESDGTHINYREDDSYQEFPSFRKEVLDNFRKK